jgi:hypothetical protein
MFEDSLGDAVTMIDKTLQDMIWRVVSRYAQLSGRPAARSPQAAYGLLDGLFQQALLGHLTGRPGALDELTAQVRDLMPYLLEPVAA